MDRQEAVKWGATGSADTAGGLVDLSNVRRMSLADNNVPVATGMFQERRAQDGPGGRSPGKGVSSWFGWKRNTDSTTQAEEVMQRKSADAARFLGTRSSAHSGKVQVHPSAQKHRLASADRPLWLVEPGLELSKLLWARPCKGYFSLLERGSRFSILSSDDWRGGCATGYE